MNRMNGKNQYRCHFCEKLCAPPVAKCLEFGKHCRWQRCNRCDVSFAVGPKCTVRGMRFIVSDPKKDKSFYQLLINFKEQKTKIDYYDARVAEYAFTGGGTFIYPGAKIVVGSDQTNVYTVTSVQNNMYKASRKEYLFKNILNLDKAPTHITPENVLEKIKMYILFS